ncbi:MAG TPA: DUF3142 domain-containing protein [Kofleriaceae bacterium]|nr:DUF3142 domain-containing protein [Kofleriaceae bacterium]
MSIGRALALLVIVAACDRNRAAAPKPAVPAHQDAYVWQRSWTPAVRDAVEHAPAKIEGLRILAAEVAVGDPLHAISLDAPSLAASGRRVTLVLRINGSRPMDDLSIAPLLATAQTLQQAGVDVAGIEVDHDCATARLAAYARWLALQDHASLRLSITALPTWAESPALRDVATAVDEIVVQVHAVRAPAIFDPNVAWHDLVRFSREVRGTPLRVALPTYGAVVRGMEVEADVRDVAAFERRLAAESIVDGVVWFRLPVKGDPQTWSPATFAHVVERGTPDAPQAKLALVARGADQFDVVARNEGTELVDLPPVRVAGAIDAADMIGYRAVTQHEWAAPHRSLAPSESITIGWIRGKDITLVD